MKVMMKTLKSVTNVFKLNMNSIHKLTSVLTVRSGSVATSFTIWHRDIFRKSDYGFKLYAQFDVLPYQTQIRQQCLSERMDGLIYYF